LCSLHCYLGHLDLHSFPTRRSSDLEKHIGVPSRSQEERIGLHLLGWFRFQFDKQSMNFASGLAGVRRRLAPSCLTSFVLPLRGLDRKSTRLNSSHVAISYAVFCLKK